MRQRYLTNTNLVSIVMPHCHVAWRSDGHNTDFTSLCQVLADAASIFGKIALPPFAAFGIWWSREFAYSQSTLTTEVLEGYATHGLPLHTVVLDYDWHTHNPQVCQHTTALRHAQFYCM